MRDDTQEGVTECRTSNITTCTDNHAANTRSINVEATGKKEQTANTVLKGLPG